MKRYKYLFIFIFVCSFTIFSLSPCYSNEILFLNKKYSYKDCLLLSTKLDNKELVIKKPFVIRKGSQPKLTSIYNALKYLERNNIQEHSKPVAFFSIENKYYLIHTYIDGEKYNTIENPLMFQPILETLFEYDKILFFHKDLNLGNILFNKMRQNINLIDFEYYIIVDNNGKYKSDIEIFSHNFSSTGLRFMNIIRDDPPPFETLHNNPIVHLPSNLSLFEIQYLYPHINCEFILKEYLKQKSKFIKQRIVYLEKLVLSTPSSNYNNEKIILKKAIEKERIYEKALKSLSNDIIQIEKSKIILNWYYHRSVAYNISNFPTKRKTNKLLKEIKYYSKRLKNKNNDLYEYAILQEELCKKWKKDIKKVKYQSLLDYIKTSIINAYELYIFKNTDFLREFTILEEQSNANI